MAHPDSENDDLAEDVEEDDTTFDQTAVHNVEWTDSDDVNLDATRLDTFLHAVDDSGERELQDDIFYDCEQSDGVLERNNLLNHQYVSVAQSSMSAQLRLYLVPRPLPTSQIAILSGIPVKNPLFTFPFMSGIIKSGIWWTPVRRPLLYSFPWQKNWEFGSDMSILGNRSVMPMVLQNPSWG